MDVQEMIVDVYEGTGEKSFLLPYTDISDASTFDIALAGSVKILKYLNLGYQKVCTYEHSGSREIVQFPSMKKTVNFKNTVETGTCQAGSTASKVVMPSGFSAVDDYYNDWVLKVTAGAGISQKAYIVDYVGSTKVATVVKDFTTTLDDTSVVLLCKNFVKFMASDHDFVGANLSLDPRDQIITMQKLTDLSNERELLTGGRSVDYSSIILDIGDPSEYYFRGDAIYFNRCPDEELWFRLEYLAFPEALTAASQEPNIPAYFHMGIVLWSIWYVLKKGQEANIAWAAKRDFQDYMKTVMVPQDLEDDRSDARVELPAGNY